MAETPSSVESIKTPESKDSVITQVKGKLNSLLADMGFKKGEKPEKPPITPEGPGTPEGPETPNVPAIISIPGGTTGTGNLDGGINSGTTMGPTTPADFQGPVNSTNNFGR